MPDSLKRNILIFLLLAVILTVLIAAALPQMQLKPGIPLPEPKGGVGAVPEETTPGVTISISTLTKAILGVILVLAVAYLVYALPRHVAYKEMVSPALVAVALVIVMFAILLSLSGSRVAILADAPEILPLALARTGPPLGPPPPILLWLVWFGLAAVVILLLIWYITGRSKGNRSDPLVLEAEQALQALKTGQDLKNVIVCCYLQMSQALKQERDIALGESMTAREFERLLEARGVPSTPVQQLTRLFEVARYGTRPPTADDEQQAFDCLNAIVQYCRRTKQPG